MRKLKRWLKDFFDPEQFNDLDTQAIADALNDVSVRSVWLQDCFAELKRINMAVDKRVLSGSDAHIIDLCARRKAYQDVLEAVLVARRHVISGTQEKRPNPRPVVVDLDRVTA